MSIYTNINDFSKKAGFLVDQVAIGMRIKEIRQYYNLTVEEFADILNISVNAVYKWQRGDSAPDITNIGIICGKFDVRIEYLMFGTGDCFRAVSCSILWELFASHQKKDTLNKFSISFLSELEGFEPSCPNGLTHFECAPL